MPLKDRQSICLYCEDQDVISSNREEVAAHIETLQTQADAVRHVQRGTHFLMKERYAEAGQEFRTAIRLNPAYAAAHGQLGTLLLKQGRAKEALAWFEKALQIDPALEGITEALQQAKAQAGVTPATQQATARYQKSTRTLQKSEKNFLPKICKFLWSFVRCE